MGRIAWGRICECRDCGGPGGNRAPSKDHRRRERHQWQAEVEDELTGPDVDEWKYEHPFYRSNGELDRLDP